MAKIGLAAELAKQAAQAARDELALAEGTAVPAASPKAVGWTVPLLPSGFMLDDAMQRAARTVTQHYRTALAPQGLQVELTQMLPETEAPYVASERQAGPDLQANLREQGTGRLVKAYTAPALLTLFATQQQATGVVVDGQV